VVTGKARAAIRRATRTPSASNIPVSACASSSAPSNVPARFSSEEKLAKVLHRLARKDVEDVLAAVGRGEVPRSM
jgi:guanosine-3',5'-bis(diphosphate) 3'-pyrophosphohydrolase